MTRVQIPAYTDRWMRGDRFGEVIKVTRSASRNTSKLRIENSVRASLLTKRPYEADREIAHVKLDVSGKTVRVILNDCTVVS
jgi:hypothetical protein